MEIKIRYIIALLLLCMMLCCCVPDRATYTNVEESIFITTERIGEDKYRIYLSKDRTMEGVCCDYFDLNYMPSELPPCVYIHTKIYKPDTIYIYDYNGNIIDFRDSVYEIKVIGIVDHKTYPYTTSRFDRYRYKDQDNLSFPVTDSVGLRTNTCIFDLNAYMDGISLLYDEDYSIQEEDIKIINKTSRTNWRNPDKMVKNGLENKYFLENEKLCIRTHRDNDNLVISLGKDSVSYTDIIELPITDRYDIDLYYMPPDTVYIDKSKNAGKVKVESKEFNILNLEYWPYEFKPAITENDYLLDTFYKHYRNYVDNELLKDKQYYRIRDFCNVENGMSVMRFYNGLDETWQSNSSD